MVTLKQIPYKKCVTIPHKFCKDGRASGVVVGHPTKEDGSQLVRVVVGFYEYVVPIEDVEIDEEHYRLMAQFG